MSRGRWVIAVTALVVAAAVLVLHVPNIFAGAQVLGRVLALVLTALAIVLLANPRPEARPHWAIGPAVLAIVYAVVFLTGGAADSPLQPAIYMVVAVSASVLSARSAVVVGLMALSFEVALFAAGAATESVLAAHVGFGALFASLFATVLRREVKGIEASRNRAVEEALLEVEQDAKDFRLIGSSLGPESHTRTPEQTTRARRVGSVRAIRDCLLDVLEAARVAVDADDAMLFMLDGGDRLRLKECVAREGEPAVIDKPAGEGAVGAVVKTARAVYLKPRSGGRGLGYKVRREVESFLGVPIFVDGRVAGVLAVDRETDADFGDRDEEVLAAIGREAARAMESERIFSEMDKVKYEQERFHEAFSLLNEALTVDVFSGALIEAVARIKPVDFLAVTLFDQEKQIHMIVGGRGAAEALIGETFKAKGGGLVQTAIKNGHPLPFVPLSSQTAPAKLVLFSSKLKVPELSSVKVFPLLDRKKPLGALVIGSTEPHRDLTREEERMLETVTVHAARTLANAQMYKRMEMMATTDGLTGLVNHRRFKELLGEALARAKRFSRRVSVLMVDADHFKSINDTFGHPVGDLVLKRIARVLESEARRTDVVARYGGEEFVVVLDETDVAGAMAVAERIRERIEGELIQGDFGRVRVTASLGLACWPEHGETMEALLEGADQALYQAKHKGRNRVEVYGGVVLGKVPTGRPEVARA